MGLDIYFSKRKIGKKKQEEVAYFRKVNCLVEWVEHNVREFDNCEDVVLSKEDITNLRNDARKVVKILKTATTHDSEYEAGWKNGEPIIEIEKVYDDKYADAIEEILPTRNGFLFGSSGYDEWYFSNVKDVLKSMNKILKETDFDKEEIIFHCWW